MQASAKSPKATLSAHRHPHPPAVGNELARAPSLIRVAGRARCDEMLGDGLMTLEKVEVITYRAGD
jgi:hypothetical protein